MNRILFYSLMLMIFVLSGCVIRTIPYDVDRVDQEIKGNRGMVKGDASSIPAKETRKTKKMYNIEIELPMKEGSSEKDRGSGNKGYIQKSVSEKKESVVRLGGSGMSDKPQVVYQMPAEKSGKYKKEKGSGTIASEEAKTYIVEKGDTLQKISDKMYGTTKKWKKIYEANKGVLKSPDMIKPGQKLMIPAE